MDSRTARYLRFYTTDDLRRRWQSASAATGTDAPLIELRGGVTLSREELGEEIQQRVWWERFGYRTLMTASIIAAVAAVIAAIEGAMPAAGSPPSSGGAQSPSGGSMVPVLALVVAILAVFFGPLVARANTQRQIRVTTRENWMREFREQIAHLLACIMNSRFGAKAEEAQEMKRAGTAAVHLIGLLIAEKGQHVGFIEVVTRLVVAAGVKLDTTISSGSPQPGDATDLNARIAEVSVAAADILRHERAAIANDPGVWREIWTSLGLDAVAWPAWLRRPTQGDPDLP